jgi:hypothetical protein
MRRSTKGLFLAAAILLAACLAAGCSSTVSSISSAIQSRTATASVPANPTTADASPTTAPASPTTAPASPTTAPASPTVTVTTTAPATTVTVTTSAPTTPSSTPSSVTATPTASSGSSLLWLWILLGALVLAGLIAWIVSASRRRSATAAGWQSRLVDAYAKGSALHDAMAVAEGPGAFGAPDAGVRWADIQRRADDLAQTLYGLRESAPDDATRARLGDTLTALQAVRSAMDAERAPGGASPMQAEVVRGRLSDFEASLRALRAPGAAGGQYP